MDPRTVRLDSAIRTVRFSSKKDPANQRSRPSHWAVFFLYRPRTMNLRRPGVFAPWRLGISFRMLCQTVARRMSPIITLSRRHAKPQRFSKAILIGLIMPEFSFYYLLLFFSEPLACEGCGV